MRDMARRSEKDRCDLFRATAQAMRVHEAIVEKDFWVCWILDYLFHDSPWKDRLAFKGGTSLSKAYGAIERFSEDIDLILDWQLLGYAEEEVWKERSLNKQNAFSKNANQKTVIVHGRCTSRRNLEACACCRRSIICPICKKIIGICRGCFSVGFRALPRLSLVSPL